MFKSAATKIAHNSTIPALGGNQDLRPLQDLILAEKAVLISLQKLSVDYSKASEALRTWGLSEGEDLGDILSASTSILNHFSSALSQYAAHGHSMRDQLKAIRTREESLDELKRRRRTVLRKADDAEKKLAKMSPEHKNLVTQTDLLNRLREEIRGMDSDIMSEEAALGDFKRTVTRMWMGLKFGGLLECCEKGTIAGEYGKLTIAEISEEITQPGLPRSLYYGHSKVEGLVAEAHRRVNEVALSTVPSVGFRERHQYEQISPNAPNASSTAFPSPMRSHGETSNIGTWSSGELRPQLPPISTLQDNSSTLPTPIRPFAGDIYETSNASHMSLPLGNQAYAPSYHQPQPSQGTVNSSFSQILPSSQQLGDNEGTVDDFGVNVRSAGPLNSSNTTGGRFATFPVKTRPPGSVGGYSLQDPPSLGGHHPTGDSSFSASVAEVSYEREDTGRAPPYHRSESPIVHSERTARASESFQTTTSMDSHFDGDPPPFEELPAITVAALPLQLPADNQHLSGQISLLHPPPPGAAPPELLVNPFSPGYQPGHSRQTSNLSDNDDALLAYMMSEGDDPVTNNTATVHVSVPPAAATNKEDDKSLGRHVRFGAVEDVDGEIEKRVSLEKEQVAQTHTSPSHLSEDQRATANPDKDGLGNGATSRRENNNDLHQVKSTGRRVPPPQISSTEEDEKALNAAAAHEVSLELEALKNNNSPLPPVPSQVDQRSQDLTPEFDRNGPMPESSSRFNDHPGPPTAGASPMTTAPLAGRNLPPHPYAELNPPGAYSSYTQQPYQPPSVSPAQAYAQSYQQQQQQSPSIPYAQPQPPDMRNTLPPRFQALSNNNMHVETQLPPRFQTSSSPIVNSLPPRFQTNYTPQVSSPGVNAPDHQQQRDDVIPPVYPRPPASTSSFNKSNTSLPLPRNTPISLQARGSTPPLNINTGARTINAAAFKRPIPRNTGSIDSDTKKMLPSSPYPVRDAGASISAGNEIYGGRQQQQRKHLPEIDDDDDIGAHVNNSSPPSPQAKDSGSSISGHAQGRMMGYANVDNGLR